MNVLVLGAGGMAGHLVATYLEEHGHAVDTLSGSKAFNSRTTILDLTNKEAFDTFLTANDYAVIVNCVGILVKQSDERKDLASYLNGFLPHFLEQRYQNTQTKIIHISTDCVFSGLNAPYDESSAYDGQLFYDRSKALGEINNSKDLTLRMSIIGPEIQQKGTGLFHWFMSQTGTIQGYTNAMWSGITTLELARGIDQAVTQNIAGIYHLVPTKNISKYALLGLFKDEFQKDINIVPAEGPAMDKTLVNTRGDFDFNVSDYPTMIAEMHQWIKEHEDIYSY